ncbi:MAG: hypothetical protein FWC80_04620 [Firmicutes bacterium]|nr:hypothetical protein [Bacillota bacterium]
MDINEIKEIETAIGFKFGNKRLLETAFTTPAFANQNKNQNSGARVESGDRLEFLGDGILKYILTHKLYMSGKKTAGQMTEERQDYERFETHAAIIDRLDIAKYLRLVDKQTVSDKMKSDLYEAVIGAIYVDKRGGIKAVRRLVEKTLFN